MKITIAQRLNPFSHLPGASCLIPWSSWKVTAYPALLKFENLITFQKQEIRLDWKGPVLDFTLELDLEQGVVWVFGHTTEGYRRVCIEGRGDQFAVVDKKQKGPLKILERLSLGLHKRLDWELVQRRHLLTEILPVWFRLGQMVPESGAKVGIAALLQEIPKMEVAAHYLKIFLAGFEGILAPRLSDTDHQGIVSEEHFSSSPLILVTEGARMIRSLFFREEGKTWSFLPCLSPDFHAGRFLHILTREGDKIDFEWSKKKLHRVIIDPASKREVFLSLPKPLKSFRLKKKRHPASHSLHLNPGETIHLDRFEE